MNLSGAGLRLLVGWWSDWTGFRLGHVPSARVAEGMAGGVFNALQARLPGPWVGPRLYLLVDDYELVTAGRNPLERLVDLIPRAHDVGLHLVIARRSSGIGPAMNEPVLRRLRELDVPGLQMSGDPVEGAVFGTVVPGALPPGRGTLVRRADGPTVVQTAWTDPD